MIVELEEKRAIASFEVDCQYCFTPECPDELPVPYGLDIVPELNAQANLAQYRLGSKESHSPHAVWIADDEHPQLSEIEGENVDLHWKAHAIPGTRGFEWIEGLPRVTDYDFFVWKGMELDLHPYGSCYHDFAEKLSTGVIEYLHLHDVTTVIMGGLATDYCVKNTALQLQRAGFKTILNKAASRGLTEASTQEAIIEMQQAGVIIVENISQLKVSA